MNRQITFLSLSAVLLALVLGYLVFRLYIKKNTQDEAIVSPARVVKPSRAASIGARGTGPESLKVGVVTPVVDQGSPLPTVAVSRPLELVSLSETMVMPISRVVPSGTTLRILNDSRGSITITKTADGSREEIAAGEFVDIVLKDGVVNEFTSSKGHQIVVAVD